MGKTLKQYADWRLHESMVDYHFYERMYERLLITMFTWEGIPDSISERYLERCLYHDGVVAIYQMGGALVASKVEDTDAFNDYDEPTSIRVGSGWRRKKLSAGEFVLIRNDYLSKPSELAVRHFAKRLSAVDKTIDVNLEQLKQPSIIQCPEGQLLTAKQLWAKRENGEPVIFTAEGLLDNIDIKVMGLDVHNHIPDLEDTKHEFINESMTYFGINNVNVIKKERLVSGETSQNDEQIQLNLNAMLKPRQDACKELKRIFDIDVSVSVDKRYTESTKNDKEEGE
jgi:hypothetical protein